jgi:hypothetical protein
MIGMQYQNGYILGFTRVEIDLLIPYLSYSNFAYSLMGVAQDRAATLGLSLLEQLSTTFRTYAGHPISAVDRAHQNSRARSNVYMYGSLGPLNSLPYLNYIGLSDDAVRYIRQLGVGMWYKLDTRLPSRGQTPAGAELVERLFINLGLFPITDQFVTPAQDTLFRHHPWKTYLPNVFPTLVDLAPWNARVTQLLNDLSASIPSRRTPAQLSSILSIRENN